MVIDFKAGNERIRLSFENDNLNLNGKNKLNKSVGRSLRNLLYPGKRLKKSTTKRSTFIFSFLHSFNILAEHLSTIC